MAKGKMYRATDSFTTEIDGQIQVVLAGRTLVREGHPLIAGREHCFELAEPDFDWEDTTDRERAGAAKKDA